MEELSDLTGKTVLITGGNTGIGYSTAHALLKRGARVILGCRSDEKASEAVRKLREEIPSAAVEFELVDLSSLRSVQDFGDEILRQEDRLDVLILNGGAMATDTRQRTREGFERTFATNYLGHFHLTNLLLPLLEKSAPSRIIAVSSGAHKMAPANFLDDLQLDKNTYGKYRAYCQSKMCQVTHSCELARRIKSKNVTVNSLHPGVIASEFFRGRWYESILKWVARSPEKGASTSIYLASSDDVRDVTGAYFTNCKQASPHRLANDREIGARLWNLSEAFVKKGLSS